MLGTICRTTLTTAPHIMAITGHKTVAEVDRYTRGARQRKMAEAASIHLGR